jgi:septum formation protein
LARIQPEFEVVVSDVPEVQLPGERPADFALRLAVAKAGAVAGGHPGATVIGADTIVVAGGDVLGKPVDAAEAEAFLRRLRGVRHTVITAVAVVCTATEADTRGVRVAGLGAEHTGVWLRSFSDAELLAYVATGHSLDKAGGYAIQHRGFEPVAHLSGSESNVVGLPVRLTRRLLQGTLSCDGAI